MKIAPFLLLTILTGFMLHYGFGSAAKNTTTAVVLNPDRLKFTHSPKFEAARFINDPMLKAGFLEPKHFRAPVETWPAVRPARVACSRDRLLALFKKWDEVNSLRLLDSNASEYRYRCGLFAVYKSSEKDRQILNPIPENGRTFGVAEATQNLSHGTLLCNLVLEPHEDLCIAATDLEDFYHCFKVTPEHSARNHISTAFFLLKCLKVGIVGMSVFLGSMS